MVDLSARIRKGSVAALCVLLLASGAASQQGAGVVIGVPEVGPSPDPHATITVGAQPLYRALFDALTEVDPEGELRPALATSWRAVSATTWEFKIRSNVKFSNGDSLTAADVQFSFDRVLGPQSTSPVRGRVDTISEVLVVDPFTIRITTKSPWALLPRAISVLPIIPARYFSTVGSDGFSRRPVGTGAFDLVEFDRTSYARLRSRTDSWRGTPRARELLLRVIPEPAVRVAALKSGEIDVAVGVPTDNVAEVRAAARRIVTGRPGRVMQFPLVCRGPLQDKKVRQALNYAIDKVAIADSIFSGYADVAQGQLVTKGAMGYNPRVRAYPYDPERAGSLIRQSSSPNGFTIKVAFSPGRYQNDRAVMEAVSGFWNKIGVRVELQNVEAAVQTQLVVTGKIENTLLTLFTFSPVMDLDFPGAFFLSNHAFNFGCKSAKYDQLFEAARIATDPVRREAQLQELAAFLREEAWSVPLVEPLDVFAMKSSITSFQAWPGFVFYPDTVGR